MNGIVASCYYTSFPMDAAAMVSNIKFAALMCRLHYYRQEAPLPDATDAEGFAEYHKVYYNTSLGAADADKNTVLFQEANSCGYLS